MSTGGNSCGIGVSVHLHQFVGIAIDDFKDGAPVSTHCDPPPGTDPCPKRYGPWTPPTAAAGGGEEDVAHTFSTAGSYNVTFTYDPGYEDACYNPYADGASGSLPIRKSGTRFRPGRSMATSVTRVSIWET